MIKIEEIEVFNFQGALRGMRNPLESWDKSDSYYDENNNYIVGEEDMKLALKLIKAGTDHSKFLRQIFVCMDIYAPDYWWKEYATYKIGTVENSTSSMHRILSKPFTFDMFSIDEKEEWNKKIIFEEVKPPNNDEEIWKDVDGFIGYYQISSFGRIRSVDRYITDIDGKERFYKGKILNQSANSSNYKKVRFCKDNEGKNLYTHRLVAEHFILNPENKPEVNHIDGNKWNNHYLNLEWVTDQENTQHAHDNNLADISGFNKHQVSQTGRQFTMSEIEEIRNEYNNGLTIKELTEKHNINYNSTTCNIVHNKTYNNIKLSNKDMWKIIINQLEELRQKFIETNDKKYWRMLIQMLPMNFNYLRTCSMNYQVLRNMYFARRNHKLVEWRDFCKMIEELPYSELITIEK